MIFLQAAGLLEQIAQGKVWSTDTLG